MAQYLHPDKHIALAATFNKRRKKLKRKKPSDKKQNGAFNPADYVKRHAYELGLKSNRG